MRRLFFQSGLARSPGRAWGEATGFGPLNYEFWPILRMTVPAGFDPEASIEDLPVGTPAGRSRLLLFGFLPVDYDELCIVEIEPPRRFLERSRTLGFSTWEHERRIEPEGEGSVLSDRLAFELRRPLRRVPGLEALAARIVSALFAHRHRRLRRRDTAAHV